MADDPRNLGGGAGRDRSNIPSAPGPPEVPSPREEIIRGLSEHKLQRLDAMLAAGRNTGDIAVALTIQSSVIVMYVNQREVFDRIRGGVDPRNLGGAPTNLPSPEGRSYRSFPGMFGR